MGGRVKKKKRSESSLAVFPGSFDPITNGHLDIVDRGLAVFDRVRMAILMNPEKQPLFTVEERVAIIREAYRGNPRVEVDTFSGLLVDYANRVGASVIIRGLRAISDFEYEFQMALMNRRLNPRIETVFMMPAESYSYVSSRLVKEVFQLGGRVTDLVPPVVERRLQREVRDAAQGGAGPPEEVRRPGGVRTAGTGPRLAARARRLEISPTVAMSAKARALKAKGVRVFDFTVGEPDQPTPRHVLDAGKAAMDAGRTKYAPASGLPELRAAVTHRYREDFHVDFAPEEVTVAVGGKQALALLYQAILDRGSEIVVPIPAWPTFAEAARVAGGTPVFVPLAERNGFRVTARAVARAITPKTRAVVVNSPSNPTGAVVEPDELVKIARLAKKHGFWLIYDDTYAHLVFRPGEAPGAPGGEGRGGRPPRGGGDGVEDLLHDRLAGGLGDRSEGRSPRPAPRSTRTLSRGRRRSLRSPRRRRSPPRRTWCARWPRSTSAAATTSTP